jgi:hypothetical protein
VTQDKRISSTHQKKKKIHDQRRKINFTLLSVLEKKLKSSFYRSVQIQNVLKCERRKVVILIEEFCAESRRERPSWDVDLREMRKRLNINFIRLSCFFLVEVLEQ